MCVHAAVACYVMLAERQGLQAEEEDATGMDQGAWDPSCLPGHSNRQQSAIRDELQLSAQAHSCSSSQQAYRQRSSQHLRTSTSCHLGGSTCTAVQLESCSTKQLPCPQAHSTMPPSSVTVLNIVQDSSCSGVKPQLCVVPVLTRCVCQSCRSAPSLWSLC
jgi:hypothetical protein